MSSSPSDTSDCPIVKVLAEPSATPARSSESSEPEAWAVWPDTPARSDGVALPRADDQSSAVAATGEPALGV